MMKLRKTLVTLLVLSMVLAGFTGVAGAEFSDTANHPARAKIAKLAALGVLAGYPDGTFKPDNNITRAEFAKIACVLAGLSSSGDILKDSPSRFSDVPAGQWYTGWVNLAVSQGYMKGYPDGTFKPSANISNAEVLTVLCRLLGYNDNLPGEWPTEYLVKAADEDISDGVKFDAGAPATRGNVAQFAEQSLDVTLVEWSKENEKFEDVTDDDEDTLMDTSFEGKVYKNALCHEWKIDGNKMKIDVYGRSEDADGDATGGFDEGSADSGTYEVSESAVLNGVAHYSGLKNKIIDFILNEDDEIIYAEVKNYGVISDSEAERISDKKLDIDDKTYTVNAKAYVNIGDDFDLYTVVDDVVDNDGAEDDAVWEGFQKITALLNDDGEVAYVFASSDDDDPAIVESVSSTTKKITYKEDCGGDMTSEIADFNGDVKDSDTTYIVFRDGKEVSVTDLKENDLLWVAVGEDAANGYDYKLVAVSSKVSGTLESHNVDLDSFDVDEESYDGWGDILLSTDGGEEFAELDSEADLEDALGEDIEGLLDGNGYIRALVSGVGETTTKMYGVVSEVFGSTSSKGYGTDAIEIFTTDGKVVKYDVDSDSDDLADALMIDDEGDPLDGELYFDVGGTEGAYDAGTDVLVESHPLVKFSLQSNGAIDTFELKTDTTTIAAADDLDDELKTVETGAGELGYGDAKIFNLMESDDADDWEMVSISEFEDYADGHDLDLVWFVESDGEITYAVVDNADITTDVEYAMVMGKGYDANGPYLKIDEKGTTKKITVEDDDGDDWGTVAKKNVIKYSLTGGEIQEDFEIQTGVTDDVYDVKTSGTKRIVFADNDTTWFFVDEDTLIYDVTGDDPEWIELSDIDEGMEVEYSATGQYIDWIVVTDD
ncbi:MAG: S-layer homology domain-containing protein [Ignavibacteriales bacterium]